MDYLQYGMDGFGSLYTEHPLIMTGFLLIFGYGAGKLAAAMALPEITGFILAGLALSACMAEGAGRAMNESLHLITEVAISFLALSIGSELSVRKMKRIGADIVVITLAQLIGTLSVVIGGLLLLNAFFPLLHIGYPYVILLAVIACATSPAIIVAEVHHLRAHGTFIDYLFGVVALSDTITVLVFGISLSVVTNLLGAEHGTFSIVSQSLTEIAVSALIGLLAAVPLHMLGKRISNQNEMMIVMIGAVFLVSGIAIVLHLSSLLTAMTMGATLSNLSRKNIRLFKLIEPITPPVYALFFIIAGIELNPAVFTRRASLFAGIAYIALRGIGKYAGVLAGCRMRRVRDSITVNLGLCMFSKGGIALGFVLLIQTSPALSLLRADSAMFAVLHELVNVVLLSIFVNELLSPFFLRYAVVKGNEMG